MELINKDFALLTPEDFDEVIADLSGLSPILAPYIIKATFEGMGVKVVADMALDLQIAADALIEIKQQIYGNKGSEKGGA